MSAAAVGFAVAGLALFVLAPILERVASRAIETIVLSAFAAEIAAVLLGALDFDGRGRLALAIGVVALAWSAVAYILFARRRRLHLRDAGAAASRVT
jgi:hypothetical protein